MAKAKKTPSPEGAEAPTKKKATRSTTSRSRKPPKKAQAAAAPAAPMIDTGLAAANAARMLAARAKLDVDKANLGSADAQKESASFKQLKESLNRPATQALNAAMGNAFGPSKANLPTHGVERQVAHNQTQGGARFNVPRRTAG